MTKSTAVEVELTVSSCERFGGDFYRLTATSDAPLPSILAGQFAHIKAPGKLLRRPICVYDSGKDFVTFIIARIGEGTAAITSLEKGDKLNVLLPLGNGFPVLPDITNIALIGGGTGCAPLLKIAKDNDWLNCTALLGFRNAEAMGVYGGDFDKYCKKVCYCTDDGSFGYRGFPTDLLTEVAPDVIYVCGPTGMVSIVQEYCVSNGVIGFASLEQRMGCGVGACLVCTANVKRGGREQMLRVCADGPVFAIEDLIL